MIIYSVVPMEQIMKNSEQTSYDYQELEVNGVRMVVESGPNLGEATIVRLISGNPQDYLNPNWMPGQTIRFVPSS